VHATAVPVFYRRELQSFCPRPAYAFACPKCENGAKRRHSDLPCGVGVVDASAFGQIRFGSYLLDTRTGELRNKGTVVKLAPQPCRVLVLLASRPGELVTRDEIRKAIWGDDASHRSSKQPRIDFGRVRNDRTARMSGRATHRRTKLTFPPLHDSDRQKRLLTTNSPIAGCQDTPRRCSLSCIQICG
jgi:hypothetical protein